MELYKFGLFNMKKTVILQVKKGAKLMDTHDILMSFSRQVKDILHDKLTRIILYGSYARGDYRENSDIDIMVLTTLTDDEIRKVKTNIYNLAFDFQMEYGIDISVIIKNNEPLPFYDNVQKEGVVLNNRNDKLDSEKSNGIFRKQPIVK